ncbi:MAG: flagellar FlbD family protein [Actinomycetales bacterium]
MLTRPSGQRFALNPDLILSVEDGPDTTVTMVDGATIPVAQSATQVAELITAYRAALIASHQDNGRERLQVVREQPSPQAVTAARSAGPPAAADPPLGSYLLMSVSGSWYIGWPNSGEPIQSRPWLDRWLAARGASIADLDFETPQAAKQFEHDFGPLDGQP